MSLSFEKILVIAVIALVLLGPDKLPYYASKLAALVRSLRLMAQNAQARMKDEMGPEFDDIDWKQMDPRQYDPRRIIRDALFEGDQESMANRAPVGATAVTSATAVGVQDIDELSHDQRERVRLRREGRSTTPLPFDDEAS